MAIHVPFSQRPSGRHQQAPVYIGFDQPRRRKRRSVNWWGVNSVVFFFLSVGVLSPLTLLMALMGLRKRPRRAAILGTILSMGGLAVMAAIAHNVNLEHQRRAAAQQNVIVARQVIETNKQLETAAEEFEQYRDDHDGRLPLDLQGAALAIKHVDPWGEEFRYEVEPDGATLRSAGPDGEFFSDDDVTYRMDGETDYQPLLPVE